MLPNRLISEQIHLFKGLDPVADAFAGTVQSDVVNLENYNRVAWIIIKGVGASGTSVVTVLASSAASPDTTSAVPFYYRAITSTDVPGAVTAAAATGFTTTAGSSQLYIVEIDAAALVAAGYSYALLNLVESVDAAVLGGILGILAEPKYGTETVAETALT